MSSGDHEGMSDKCFTKFDLYCVALFSKDLSRHTLFQALEEETGLIWERAETFKRLALEAAKLDMLALNEELSKRLCLLEKQLEERHDQVKWALTRFEDLTNRLLLKHSARQQQQFWPAIAEIREWIEQKKQE